MTELAWRPTRVFRPVRFTHDRDGYLLLNQEGRRKSRWFERVMVCTSGLAFMDRAYMPRPEVTKTGGAS